MRLNNEVIGFKLNAFEYLLALLIEWHQEETQEKDAYLNDFSKLSILKLLFFTAAVPNSTKQKDLLDIFNNFAALRFGPVESDIYNSLSDQSLRFFKIDNLKYTLIKPDSDISDIKIQIELDNNIKDRIEQSIDALKNKNKKIVTYSSFELVDISHKWNCWKICYDLANITGRGSFPIETNDIQLSSKYYDL